MKFLEYVCSFRVFVGFDDDQRNERLCVMAINHQVSMLSFQLSTHEHWLHNEFYVKTWKTKENRF